MSPKKIEINIEPEYIDNESYPDKNQYVFAYTIRIHNKGDAPALLKSRHWIITDANNQTEELRGKGVVGEQPTIEPGEYYEYYSGAIIETPVGSMHGSYQFVDFDGSEVSTEFPALSLAVPNVIH